MPANVAGGPAEPANATRDRSPATRGRVLRHAAWPLEVGAVRRDRGGAVDDLEVAARGDLPQAVTAAAREERRGHGRLPVGGEDQVADVQHLVLRRVRLVEAGLDVRRQRGDRAEREADRVDVVVGQPRVAPAPRRRRTGDPSCRAGPRRPAPRPRALTIATSRSRSRPSVPSTACCCAGSRRRRARRSGRARSTRARARTIAQRDARRADDCAGDGSAPARASPGRTRPGRARRARRRRAGSPPGRRRSRSGGSATSPKPGSRFSSRPQVGRPKKRNRLSVNAPSRARAREIAAAPAPRRPRRPRRRAA